MAIHSLIVTRWFPHHVYCKVISIFDSGVAKKQAFVRNEFRTTPITVPVLTHIAFITIKFTVRQAMPEYKKGCRYNMEKSSGIIYGSKN